jgi:hypothetical protein
MSAQRSPTRTVCLVLGLFTYGVLVLWLVVLLGDAASQFFRQFDGEAVYVSYLFGCLFIPVPLLAQARYRNRWFVWHLLKVLVLSAVLPIALGFQQLAIAAAIIFSTCGLALVNLPRKREYRRSPWYYLIVVVFLAGVLIPFVQRQFLPDMDPTTLQLPILFISWNLWATGERLFEPVRV